MTTLVYSTEQALTVTNLHSLASSATAGWGSQAIDNTGNLYLGAEVTVYLDPANTAPANSKAFFVYAYGSTNSTNYGTTGAATGGTCGTEGALTFPDVTTTPNNMKLLGTINYQNADVPQMGTFNVESAFGGILPPFWGVAIVNHSGAALAASGNYVKWRGITVA